MPEYKALNKLIDNIIIGLENDAFKRAEKLEEFLAIKWTRAALLQIKSQIAVYNKISVNKEHKKTMDELEEALLNKPDGII